MKVLFVLLFILVSSCGKIVTEHEMNKVDVQNYTENIKVVEVDGCEYVLYNGYKQGGIIHKENCKNYEHRRK